MKSKVTRFDNFLFGLFDRYLYEIAMVFILVISVVIRMYLTTKAISGDYNCFLCGWVGEYRAYGVTKGLVVSSSNYYVLYNYILALASVTPWKPYVIISLTSCMADYIGAYFLYRISLLILNERDCENAVRKAQMISVACLFLPCILMNGALWKQCDSIYTCFLIIALYMCLMEQ